MYALIILDRVSIRGYDGQEYTLTFHIPSSITTLIVLPNTIDLGKIAKLLTGLEKPGKGIIKFEFGKKEIKTFIYEPLFIDDPYINIYELLYELLGESIDDLLRIIEGLGFKIDREKIGKELPRSLKKLLSILYILYKEGDLTVLVEPYSELDNTMLSILYHEIKRFNSKGKTIVVLTNSPFYLRAEIDLYDYAIVVDRNGEITTGDHTKFKGREILRNTYIYEVRGSHDFLEKLIRNPGLKGFVKIGKNYYWVFVERGYRLLIGKVLQECLRKKLITYYRFLGRQRIRG